MSLQLENSAEFAAEIKAQAESIIASISKAVATVDEKVVSQFRDEQLSGRYGNDVGLNVRKGTLHDSIKSMVEVADSQIIGTVYNTGAEYWEFHQKAMGHNPKRLFFDEYFQDFGLKMYADAVEEVLGLAVAV